MSVVVKTASLLDVVSSSAAPMSLAALQQELRMPKSSVFRLATEMTNSGFLRRTADGHYTLGFRLLYWGRESARRQWLARVAQPTMAWLRSEVGEGVHLYVRSGASRVCIAAEESTHNLRTFPQLGRELPVQAGAAGKVLMAELSTSERDRLLSEAPERPDGTTLHAHELEEVLKQGYATSEGEREVGLSAIAVPLREADAEAVGALTVSGASARLDHERLLALLPLLRDAATRIEKELAESEPQASSKGLGPTPTAVDA